MKIFTKLSHVNIKNTSHCQSDHGETLKNREIVQSWHTKLVNMKNLKQLWRRNRKLFHFTTSYKNNLVKL